MSSKPTLAGQRDGRTSLLISRVFVMAALIGVATYFLLPVYWLTIAATKTQGDLFTTNALLPAGFHFWENLTAMSSYDGGIFWRWVLNTVIYSIFGAALTTFLSVMTGYALAIYRFKGRPLLIAVVLASMLVPGTILAQPTYILLVKMGLNNNYLGVLLPALVYPFGVLLGMIYARQAVPTELVEAARLDAASEFRIFLSLGLRLMSNGLVTIMLFAFLGSWNNYILPLYVLTDQEMMPLTVGLTGWQQASITIPQLQSFTIIGAFISVIPVAIVFVSLQRYWRSGLATGGLKG